MKKIVALLIAMVWATAAHALTASETKMLNKAKPYFPVVLQELAIAWPDMPYPSYIPAQIEQESLWNPRAELKTSREYGFGFGQFTITSRFNAFNEVKAMDPRLKNWSYDDRFNPEKQILAVIVKNRQNFKACRPLMQDDWNRLACAAASYNGGYGGFVSDRRLCSNTAGCNPRIWWGNVENTSLKSRTKWNGYGKSAYEINREYPVNTMKVRRPKYVPCFEGRVE